MTSDRPNVLVVMYDQHTPGMLGCHGGPAIAPTIDRLAAKTTECSCRMARVFFAGEPDADYVRVSFSMLDEALLREGATRLVRTVTALTAVDHRA